ncbi:hypothetical protein [Microlunatus parietis]|uniref:Uncharacterized protein n=1 Tax=Microlunatus parietis TaxID=682979 RepID=A0A7Y9LC49_9ACTN|nr:hypothetical protein [Microlunatus parietis]NYE74489.1 hypothetical protein [Microlunatus parietis]
MTDEAQVNEALTAARAAHAAATEALARAEAAARAAGVEPDGTAAPELRVQRLRVVEPDGTTRMIIGNSAMSNFAPIRGRDVEHPDRGNLGGIIFCNDEGTEAGGLAYAGGKVDGEPRQLGFWSVDDFEQNEGFRLGAAQEGDRRSKWIEFADQPFFSVADFLEEAEGKTGAERDGVAAKYWPDDAGGNGILRLRLSRRRDRQVPDPQQLAGTWIGRGDLGIRSVGPTPTFVFDIPVAGSRHIDRLGHVQR